MYLTFIPIMNGILFIFSLLVFDVHFMYLDLSLPILDNKEFYKDRVHFVELKCIIVIGFLNPDNIYFT